MTYQERRSRTAWLLLSSAIASGIVLLPYGVLAAGEDKPLEEVVVTGSAIPLPPDASTASVQVLTADTLAQTGISSNLLDIMRKAVPEIAGRGNVGSTNANNTNQKTFGGSQLLLNNTDTLVLVNGRRVAYSGANAVTNGKNFVDISQFPASAIDHVEVLDDGASAIYGSDAVGGVINVILKTDMHGGDIGTHFGFADGHAEESGYAVYGGEIGELEYTVSANFSHSDPLKQSDRNFSKGIFGTVTFVPGAIGYNGANPGAVLASGVNSPSQLNATGTSATQTSVAGLIANGTYTAASATAIRKAYDVAQYTNMMLAQDQQAVAATWTYEVSDTLSAFGDFNFGHTSTGTDFKPFVTNITVPANSPFNPLTTAFPNVNFGDPAHGNTYDTDTSAVRFTVGANGKFGDGWTWEAAYVHSQSDLGIDIGGLIYGPNLALAAAGGYDASGNAVAGGAYSKVWANFTEDSMVLQPALNPFATGSAINQASLNNVFGTEHLTASTQLDSFDAKLTGKLFSLPAGKIRFAIGTQVWREAESSQADANGTNTGPTAQRWLGGIYNDPFSASRTVEAAFIETNFPITSNDWNIPGAHAVDLVAAGRFTHYSDMGSSKTPEYGFRWQPIDSQVTLRGTYSKSFTAPTLAAMTGPTDTRQIGTGVILNTFGINNLAFNGEDGNNPNLKPSTAQTKSISATIVPNALENLTLKARYSMIDQQGIPAGIGFNNILASVNALGSASPFAGNLATGNFPGLSGASSFTQPGQVLAYLKSGGATAAGNLYAVDQFRNNSALRIRTLNLSEDYVVPTKEWGVYTLDSSATIFNLFKYQALPIQAYYNYAGTATNVEGTLPRYRLYTTLDGQWGPWDAMIANTYIDSLNDTGTGGATASKPYPVKAYTTFDLRVAYTGSQLEMLSKWKLAAGINNIFNRMPPLSPNAYTDNLADVSTYSPLGRLAYIEASAKF